MAYKSLAYLKSSTIGGYMFDVVFKENYQFDNQITQNPVQSGANINDHVYQQPVVITFDIGMSDCLASRVDGQFGTLNSRSASAFSILYDLWQKATVVQINTYLNDTVFSWKNMLIKSLSVLRDKTTHHAIRATVTMQQIIVSSAVSTGVDEAGGSATGDNALKRWADKATSNKQVTGETDLGQRNPSQIITSPFR